MIGSARLFFLRNASTQGFRLQATSLRIISTTKGGGDDYYNKYDKLSIEKEQRILELERALDQRTQRMDQLAKSLDSQTKYIDQQAESLEKQRALYERVIAMLEVDSLRSKRALTGRGILEIALKRANTQVNTLKRFNAAAVGEKLDALKRNSGEAEFQSDPFIARLLAQNASYKELFQKLSLDLHDYPWAGVDVLVSRENLTVEEIKALEAIADEYGLQLCVQN